MSVNILMVLDLKPAQKRQITGILATLRVVRDYGYGPHITPRVRRVRDELAKALLPDATFDTVVGAKYLLNDLTGYVRLTGANNLADCLVFVGESLQSVFNHYTNLDDVRGL